ncbi:hypothetical protein QUB30_16750 [Microcoleus sp. BROC3]
MSEPRLIQEVGVLTILFFSGNLAIASTQHLTQDSNICLCLFASRNMADRATIKWHF